MKDRYRLKHNDALKGKWTDKKKKKKEEEVKVKVE